MPTNLQTAYLIYQACAGDKPGKCDECPLWAITIKPAGAIPMSVCTVFKIIEGLPMNGEVK